MTAEPTREPLTSAELEEHLAGLEEIVDLFARKLNAAQADGVSHALILPRMMLAFRRSFGEPPPGFVMPAGLLG